jgi:hypothetical protein
MACIKQTANLVSDTKRIIYELSRFATEPTKCFATKIHEFITDKQSRDKNIVCLLKRERDLKGSLESGQASISKRFGLMVAAFFAADLLNGQKPIGLNSF